MTSLSISWIYQNFDEHLFYQDLGKLWLENKFQFQGSQSLQGVQLRKGKEAAQPIFEDEVHGSSFWIKKQKQNINTYYF